MMGFELPHGNIEIAFSGGRTSAYMLHRILELNGDLPDRARVVFTNTGREMPETLDFIREVSARWGVKIDWIEYRAERPYFEIVGQNSASVNGEPFDAMLDKKKYLPNRAQRFCTIELKILTAKRFLVSNGWKKWTCAIGIRADEQRRIKSEVRGRSKNWYPLADTGITKNDVAAFWGQQSFDLRLPLVNGKTIGGNCDGCFLKSEATQAALARDMPERFAWWERAEMRVAGYNLAKGKRPEAARFSRRFSRTELREDVERQMLLKLSPENFFCQKDGGECI